MGLFAQIKSSVNCLVVVLHIIISYAVLTAGGKGVFNNLYLKGRVQPNKVDGLS